MLAMGIDYKLDIVMCIDATKSMSYFLRNFGESAITFYQKYVEEMELNGIEYSQLRIKVLHIFIRLLNPRYNIRDDESNIKLLPFKEYFINCK